MENQKLPQNGIIYCATGKKFFLDEALISAESVRRYNKNIGISIFVDKKIGKILENQKHSFNSIHIIENPEYTFGDKIFSMINTPYQRSFYLDCDTLIIEDFSEIFSILKKWDIGAINIPFKNQRYPEYNAGIIAFRMNQQVKEFLKIWDNLYDRVNHANDQPTFYKLVNNFKISFFTLPPNYNFRLKFASYVIDKIKIIHNHEIINMKNDNRQKIINLLNKTKKERVWFPWKGIIELQNKDNLFTNFLFKLEDKIFSRIIKNWKRFIRRRLINFWLFYLFPCLRNWLMPKDYRNNIKRLNKNVIKFIN